jgi:predicted RNA-binding Zn-ribbon protein involved in translation (DUF1610 family)
MEYLQKLQCDKCGLEIERCEYCKRIDCNSPLCDNDASLTFEYEVYSH